MSGRPTLTVALITERRPWPYLQCMARLPIGPKATAAVSAFVCKHGIRTEPTP